MKAILLTAAFLLHALISYEQGPAKINEYNKTFKTYPFSDPDPIPEIGKIYPYYRFDGYTDKAVNKEWKVVELENDYIKVMILPEIGGKIWAAFEKTTGKSFLYYNFGEYKSYHVFGKYTDFFRGDIVGQVGCMTRCGIQ